MGHNLEFDISPECSPDGTSCFPTVLGVLRWMIELGRVDIITKVSFLLSHLLFPRGGHLDAAVYVMAYVGQKYNSRLKYDLSYLKF